ncbi:MAG TPA: neutral/alkaline non-lysosomal ceramidase N-terminal domain-containing protein [Terriglobales bacterium]|nr:neutral/alkaline non-lysosomal ceramidase N-terminal domain-containing protein [Terriglobales bacterium]
MKESDKRSWKVGIARRVITPPPGVELAGLGYFLERTWQTIHDDINATALVVSDDHGKSVAIVALDVLYMDSEYVEAIREKAAAGTDLQHDAICVNCSHSHNAPTMGFFDGAGEIDPDYVQSTVERAAEAIIEAWKNRKAAVITTGSQHLPNVTYNRTRDNGPVDDRVSVLRADTLDGKPLAIMVNFHAHPTVFWQVDARAVSRDAPGQIVDLLEKEFPGATAMYVQGTCGDVNFNLEYWTPEHHLEAGQVVFDAVKAALKKSRVVANTGIGFTVRKGLLPARRWKKEEILAMYEEGKHRLTTGDTSGWLQGIASTMVGIPHRLPERYGGSVEKAVQAVSRFAVRWGEDVLPKYDKMPETRTVEFQALRIGDAWIVTNPAEFFSTLALEIRKRWLHDDLFILGYSNGSTSYLPDAFEVDRNSYASLHVPKAVRQLPFTRESGMAAVAESVAALKDVTPGERS